MTAEPSLTAPTTTEPPAGRGTGVTRGLSRNVLVLGLVSLFTDMSSEMIAPVRILFLVLTLHTPLPIAGMIEGIAESSTSFLKIASGWMADRVERRKPVIVAGYGLSNLMKPLLALVTAWQAALGVIVVDRVGKGLRTSPRDTLLAEAAPPGYRGKVFGFHRGMDTLGAAIGPLFTVAILAMSNDSLRAVFAWTALPGIIALIVALFFLRDSKRKAAAKATAVPAETVSARKLPAAFWWFAAIATIFSLGNSSDAFIFLRTEGIEQSLEAVPMVYFAFNIVYALLALPLGSLSDRRGRLPILLAGYVAFGLVYLGWAYANVGWNVWALFLLYGVYAAATEGVGKALVSDLAPGARRGTALGWYAGMTGLAALPSNIIGGWLWSAIGPSATFVFGASCGLTAAVLLAVYFVFVRNHPGILPQRARGA